MPNGVIGNTTDSGSVKSRFEPWLGNKKIVTFLSKLQFFFISLHLSIFRKRNLPYCFYNWLKSNNLADFDVPEIYSVL